MLLSITTTHTPASDLGYLLHKHPDRLQSFDVSFGQAHVFYPEVTAERTTACLMLEVDPVGAVRGKSPDQAFLLAQYVHDRPYVASSLLSVALSRVFGSALNGRCERMPELAATKIPLAARLEVLAVRGGEACLRRVFEPLGYDVEAVPIVLDEQFPEWGPSHYFTVTIRQTTTLAELLTHLYVLVPVFDGQKHYFVGEDELEKLLDKGSGWLASHPARGEIVARYLRKQPNLYRQALARLIEEEEAAAASASDEASMEEGAPSGEDAPSAEAPPAEADPIAAPLRLNALRMATVTEILLESGARTVIDFGCGAGNLLAALLRQPQFESIVGVDVSIRALEAAERRLKLDRLPSRQQARLKLMQGSLVYRDARFAGFAAAAVVEVVEHLDPPRLAAFERVLFECARPQMVVLTTPNREYNAVWESLPAGDVRHPDHRFEWTRAEFHDWASTVAARHGYRVRYRAIGPEHEQHGPPTQCGIFERDDRETGTSDGSDSVHRTTGSGQVDLLS